MIHFTARWCKPCQEMERNVFLRRKVAAAASEFLALRADLTDDTSDAKKLEEQFEVKVFPTIVFLDANGKEHRNLRLTGYERAEDFLIRLQAAR